MTLRHLTRKTLLARRRRMVSSMARVMARSATSDGEEEPPLSPRSTLCHEKGFDIHVVAIIGFKTKVDVDDFKANLPDTLLKHPRFSSLVIGDPSRGEELRWVRQAKVDLRDHIVLPEIGMEAVADPDKYLEDYICNLSKSGVHRSKPLWEMHVINLRTSHSESVPVFRIHHSLGDGTSLISLLLACTRQVKDPTAVPTIPATRTHKNRSGKENETLTARWRGLLVAIWVVVELWWNTAVDVASFIATSIYLKDTATPLSGGPKTLEYVPRKVVFKTVNLNDIKLIKNAFNGTVNDVLLGITQAGMSKYLNRKYDDDEKKNNLPTNIRLRSVVMVNTRPSAVIQKTGAISNSALCNTTLVFSNVVGPMEEIQLFGHTLQFIAPSVYGLPHALLVYFLSYVDELTIVISVDEDTIPNASQLCDDIVNSLILIKKEVISKGLA